MMKEYISFGFSLLLTLSIFIIFVFASIAKNILFENQLEVVKILVNGEYESWQGAGVFIEDDLILTAGHIVDGAIDIQIEFQDGTIIDANNWYLENPVITDLGIIEVNTPNVELSATFCNPKVNQDVWAIGNPFGFFPVTTKGIISAVNVNEDFFGEKNIFITDCALNPGNSGCPLFDSRNRILGICVGGIPYSQGMNFCIPAKICELVIEKYKAIVNLERAK